MSTPSYGTLYKVPLELRLKIYAYVLVSDFFLTRPYELFPDSSDTDSESGFNTSILLTSKAIHHEARSVLYSQSTMKAKFQMCIHSSVYDSAQRDIPSGIR